MKRTPFKQQPELSPTAAFAWPRPVRAEKPRKPLRSNPKPPGTPQRNEYMRRKPPKRLGRPGADAAYIRWLHSQPCVICGSRSQYGGPRCPGVLQASHIRRQTGMSLKPPDRHAVPMHKIVHQQWDAYGGMFDGWGDERRWAWAEPLFLALGEEFDREVARKEAAA